MLFLHLSDFMQKPVVFSSLTPLLSLTHNYLDVYVLTTLSLQPLEQAVQKSLVLSSTLKYTFHYYEDLRNWKVCEVESV